MVTRWVTLAAACAAVLGAACVNHKPYACTAAEQCTRDGIDGVCESQGFCSFPDPGCPGGRRFDDSAGNELAGQCVDSVPDAGPCGAVGQACCPSGDACVDNAFCDGTNTCTQCVVDVVHGRRHGCALEHDGSVWCFGENGSGQLGSGTTGGTPTAIPGRVVEAGTGAPIGDASAIGAGHDWACAVRTGGSVWCWGNNGAGQLGDNTTDSSPAAVQVVDAGGQPLTGVVSVAGGECSTCALDQAGTVSCWGCNGNGDLGDGTTTTRSTAAPVLDALGGAPIANVRALHVGGGHVCVERDGGEVLCWGQNNNGQIGDDTTDAKLSPVVSTFTGTVATGRWHTCGVGDDGTVMCWGWGGHGRLANGVGWDPPDVHVPTPIAITPGGQPLTGARAVAAGAQSCAVMIDGTARCWGDDQYGQTGVGGTGSPLTLPDGKGNALGGIVRMWAQHTRACAELTTGSIVCWGRNYEGELADPSLVNHTVPTPIGLTCQ